MIAIWVAVHTPTSTDTKHYFQGESVVGSMWDARSAPILIMTKCSTNVAMTQNWLKTFKDSADATSRLKLTLDLWFLISLTSSWANAEAVPGASTKKTPGNCGWFIISIQDIWTINRVSRTMAWPAAFPGVHNLTLQFDCQGQYRHK